MLSLTLTSCRGLRRCLRALTLPLPWGPKAALCFGLKAVVVFVVTPPLCMDLTPPPCMDLTPPLCMDLTPPLCMDLTPPLYSGLMPEATNRALKELRRSVVIRTAIVSDASLKSAVDTSRHWRLTTANCI